MGITRRLHRLVGIAAAVVLLYLAVTGLPLQFTQQLALGARYVHNPWVLDHYGLGAPAEALAVNDTVFIGGQLYWRYRYITEQEDFLGSIKHQNLMVLAGRRRLLLFDPESPEIQEQIQVPSPIEKLGRGDGYLYVRLIDGGLLRLDDSMLNLEPVSRTPDGMNAIRWIVPQRLTAAELQLFQQEFRQHLLTYERFLQDLHSGRIIGAVGVWIVNIAALGLLLLSITGLSIWWRSRLPKEFP